MKSLALGLILGTLWCGGSFAHAAQYSTMKLAHDGKCVDINGGSSQNELQLQQWTCNGSIAQDFQFIAQTNGTYEIRTRTGQNLCVDVQGGNGADLTRIQQYKCNGSNAQRFTLQARDGGYSVRPVVNPQSCLDLGANGTNDGDKLIEYSCNGGKNQLFAITLTGSTTTTPAAPSVDAKAFSLSSPSMGTKVSGTFQIKGVAGSTWKNIAVYDVNRNYAKVANDVIPSGNTFTLNVDSTKVADGDLRLAVIAFSVAAGQTGGTSQVLNLSLQVANVPAAPALDANALSLSSPSASSKVSGTFQIKGIAGSNWKNIAVYDVNRNYAKVANDVIPSNNAFTLTVDSTKVVDGDFRLAVIAFSVAAGQTGGTSQAVNLNLVVSNGVAAPAPVVTRPTPIAAAQFSNYAVTFEDTFSSLDSISLGSQYTGAKWYNGTEQCCMVDSTGLPAVMFPTQVNGVQVNPYTLLPNGGGLGISLDKKNNVWYSGVLTSVDANKKGFTQQYGYFEMKAKMPSGDGVWPAFWMLSTDPNMPGEIDMLEYYGHDQGTAYGITLHDWRNGGNNSNIQNPMFFPKVSGMVSDFHTYGMLWTEQTMTFYFDGQQVWQSPTPDVMKQPYYLLLNNGLGGYWPTNNTPDHSVFEIQYIRAYGPK